MAFFRSEDFPHELEELLLLRKLKDLAKFWSVAPEEINASSLEWKYNGLALHLASPFFLTHASVGIKLLTAYNLAQVLRIRQGKHPYTNEQLNYIILFLISQLQRVRCERIDIHKYQEVILAILVSQDVIPVICNLIELERFIVNVFSSLLNVAHPGMSLTTMEGMVKLVGALVEHSPNVPYEMIQMIFFNCQNRVKTSNKLVYDITVEFIRKYCDTLWPAIEKVMFKDLLTTYSSYPAAEGENVSTLDKFKRSLARLWKLHGICSDLTIPILRNLESVLYTMAHECRCILMIFLGKLFSNPSNIELYQDCSSLWNAFLARFQDKKLEIRLSCLDQVPDLFKMEVLRADLASAFGKRKMDRIPKVRHKLALVVNILLKDSHLYTPEIISNLSTILGDLTMDPEFKVRCSGLRSMAELYDLFAGKGRAYLPAMKEMEKYPNYILQHYWSYEKQYEKERLTVIQLLNRCVTPYSMPPDQRMKRLLKVLAALDYSSCTTFAKIKYYQHINCKHLLDIINVVKESRAEASIAIQRKKITLLNISAMSLHLPLPFQAAILSVNALARKLSEDGPEVEAVIRVLTHESLEDIDQILEFFKENRKYTDEFMWIFELSSDWLFDKASFKIFVSYVDDIIRGSTDLLDELNLEEFPLENVFTMLEVLSATCLSKIHDHAMMKVFISWLQMFEDRTLKLYVLKILTLIQSEDKELLVKYPEIVNELIFLCQDSCSKSDTELAKWSIKSLMIAESKREELSNYLWSTVEDLVKHMTSSEHLRAYCSIYYLGYISLYMGSHFKDAIPDVLSDRVIHKVMIRNVSSSDISSFSFASPPIHLKMKARYLKFLSQYAFEGGVAYEDTLSLLFKIIEKGGKIGNSSSQRNDGDAWMRFSAGCAVLRILRGGTMDMLTCQQFYLLSGLINDEVPEVRESFFEKLCIALHCDYPKITLPPELLSLLIMGNLEEFDLEAGMENDTFNTVRYLFSMKIKFTKIHMEIEAFPEFGSHKNEVLVYGLLALSHSKIFTRVNALEQLKKVEVILKILLNFLLTHEYVDFSFYQKQVEMVKSHKLKGENEEFNKKLWILCDIASFIMKKGHVKPSKMTMDPTLPMQFFEPKIIKNSRNYLSKKVIATLFVDGDQSDQRSKTKDDEEVASEYESDETDGVADNLVVTVGEGNMTAEWDLEDETSYRTNEDSVFDSQGPSSRRNSRKRKRSDV